MCDCWSIKQTNSSISEKEVLYWTSFYNNYIVIGGHIDCKFVKNKNNNLLPYGKGIRIPERFRESLLVDSGIQEMFAYGNQESWALESVN